MRAKGALLLMLTLAVAACGRPEDQETGSIDPVAAQRKVAEMPAALRAQLDSGDVAFRAKDMEAALRHYQAVTEIDEGVAAGWFGVYMAQKAMGNADEALAALERVQQLAPGATLVQPTAGDTAS